MLHTVDTYKEEKGFFMTHLMPSLNVENNFLSIPRAMWKLTGEAFHAALFVVMRGE